MRTQILPGEKYGFPLLSSCIIHVPVEINIVWWLIEQLICHSLYDKYKSNFCDLKQKPERLRAN